MLYSHTLQLLKNLTNTFRYALITIPGHRAHTQNTTFANCRYHRQGQSSPKFEIQFWRNVIQS